MFRGAIVRLCVQDGQLLIVDEFTGRILQGGVTRGLHQALEAKEGVKWG